MLNQSVLQRAILATVLAIFNVSVVANIELPEDEKPEKKIEALRVCADPGRRAGLQRPAEGGGAEYRARGDFGRPPRAGGAP